MYCSQCGAKNADDARACGNCGAFFSNADRPQPPQGQTPYGRRDPASPPYGAEGPVRVPYPPQAEPQPRRSALQIVLWVLAGVLTVAVIVLLYLLLSGGRQPEPSPAPYDGEGTVIVTPAPEGLPAADPTPQIITPAPLQPPTPVPATPTPIPATPTPIPPTAPPATASPSSGQVTLVPELQQRINIFLSNFSEQGVLSFNAATVADDYIIRVVEIYCKINHPSCISYADGEECLSLTDANVYLNRFFGRTVNPYEGAEYLLSASQTFRFSGGYFRFPAADGEAYNKFTVVYEMLDNGDGTFTANFQIFELNLEEYWDGGMDSGLYWLSNDDTAALVFSGRITPIQGGTAVVKPYTFNGRETYQIQRYEVWNIIF